MSPRTILRRFGRELLPRRWMDAYYDFFPDDTIGLGKIIHK